MVIAPAKHILAEKLAKSTSNEESIMIQYKRLCDPEQMRLWTAAGIGAQAVFGLFAGMFIGCLALAIAEMLDSIPIFARRISFRHGLGGAILGMAAGKICGSLFYFATELHRTVQ